MSWQEGLTWTSAGYDVITQNPDNTQSIIGLHSGPFYFNKRLFGILFVYVGFRPTPTWGIGYGDEGILGGIARYMKRKGCGNFGIALRLPHA